MNILVVTELYPGSEKETELDTTYFLHYMAKSWNKINNVKVINSRRIYPKIFNLVKRFNKKNKYYKKYKFIKDNISIYRCRIKAIPIPKITEVEVGLRRNLKKVQHELYIEKFQPDIIICHMMYPAFNLVLNLKKKYKVPLVLCFHGSDETIILRNKRNIKILKKHINNIDVFGFRSEKLKEKINKLIEIPSDKSIIVNSGVEKEKIIDKEALDIKVNKNIKVISTVSRLEKRKNIDKIIKAFSKIKNRDNLVLNIIGEGEEFINLKNLVNNLKLQNNVNFLGKKSRDEVIDSLRKSDVFTLVSDRETLGLVYLEAMSQGCIVIGSKGEGIDGIIKNNINGYLVDTNDIEELTNIFESIIKFNSSEKKYLLSNSINTINKLTNDEVAQKYLQDIFKVLNSTSKNSK